MNCNPSISKVTDGMVSRMVWDGISGPKACVPHTLTANIEPMIPNAIMMEPITNPVFCRHHSRIRGVSLGEECGRDDLYAEDREHGPVQHGMNVQRDIMNMDRPDRECAEYDQAEDCQENPRVEE